MDLPFFEFGPVYCQHQGNQIKYKVGQPKVEGLTRLCRQAD